MVEKPFDPDEAIKSAVELVLNGSSREEAFKRVLGKYTFENQYKGTAELNLQRQLNNISPTWENMPGITAINKPFSIQLESDLVFVGQADIMGIDNSDPFFFIWKIARPHEVKKTHEAEVETINLK